jgi:hypothetical protein
MSQTVEFMLSDREVEELDLLVSLSGLDSRKDLLNVALTVYRWAAYKVMEGEEIASVSDKHERYSVLQISVFEKLREHSKRIQS